MPVPTTASAVLPDVSEPLVGTPVPVATFTPLVVDSPAVVASAWDTVCSALAAIHACPDLHVLLSLRVVPGRAGLAGGEVYPVDVGGYEIAPNTSTVDSAFPGPAPSSPPFLRRTLVWRKVLQAVVDGERLDVEVPYPRGAPIGDATELARSLGQDGLDWPTLSAALADALGTPVSLSPLRSVSRRIACPVDPAAIRVLGAWQLVERLELVGPGGAAWSEPAYVTIPVPPVENRTGTVHLEVTAFPRPQGSLP